MLEIADLPESPPSPARVLIVDDEETVRNLLALVVARAGASVEQAADGREAKARLDAEDFACVLLDKNLPDMSGLEVLAHARQARPRTEVIVVTGYANLESVIECLRLGAFDYIVKPFEIVTIQQRIAHALDRRRLRDERDRLVDELRTTNARLAESRQELGRAYLESVLRLALVAEHRDAGARGHVRRISRYAGVLARAIEAADGWVENIVLAAPLHDIGMIAVPDEILRKPGPLSDRERASMREHVNVGARVLEGITADVMVLGREIVLSHHERWDGTGYPRGLRGEDIPLAGRILAVVDAWDALTTDRAYRRAPGPDRATAELEALSGTQFDPTLVAAFLERKVQAVAILSDPDV